MVHSTLENPFLSSKHALHWLATAALLASSTAAIPQGPHHLTGPPVSSGSIGSYPIGPFDPCNLPMAIGQYADLEFVFEFTAWRVHVQNRGLKGLWIGPVEFRRPNDAEYQTILKEAGPAEIFVPYHEGPPNDPNNPPRLYDLRFPLEPFGRLVELDAGDLPASGGTLVTLTNDVAPRVVTEEHETGLAWACKGAVTGQGRTRRGREALVWAIYDGGNYDNIIQYGFRDDGTLTFRLGVTGYTNPAQPLSAHMHDCLWMVDVDLLGSDHDSVSLSLHDESSGTGALATDDEFPLSSEGAFEWDPLAFTSLVVEDAVNANSYGHPIGYQLVPWNRQGTARHFANLEQWTQNDFYLTYRHENEFAWRTSWTEPDTYLLGTNGIGNNETLTSLTDPVLWVVTSAHHDPHDEDHAPGDSPSQVNGITLIHWSGFDLVPHDFMTSNPLGGPSKCEPQFCPLPQPCAAFYRFEEANNTILDDALSNDGTASGPVHVAGLIAQSLSFDGVNDVVTVPDNASLNFGSGSFTVEGWVNPNVGGSTRVVLDKRTQSGAAYNGYELFLYSTGRFGLQLSTGTPANYLSTVNVPLNTWSHLAAVVDRSGPCPTVSLYLNGLKRGSFPLSLAANASVSNTAPLLLGKNAFGGGFFSGALDEIAVYPRALTWKEILCIAQIGSGGKQ
jgi:primary-amine oxidase